MNKQELIKKYEETIYAIVATDEVLKNLKQLDEPQSDPIKLKDVIKRIKDLDIGARNVWLNEILTELGSDFGSKKYRDGYEQGKVEGLIEREKVQIPKLVAEEIERFKESGDWDLFQAMDYSFGNNKIREWLEVKDNQEIFARAWLDGYEVEEEPKYIVKMKGLETNFSFLNLNKAHNHWMFSSKNECDTYQVRHTRKELEEAGFGWVFDCPGIEIEEVKG